MSFPRLDKILCPVPAKEQEKKVKMAANQIAGISQEGDEEEKSELVNKVKNFPYLTLLSACKMNKDVEDYCRTNTAFIDALKDKIKDASGSSNKSISHPSLEIISMDNAERYSVFDLYIASMFERAALSRQATSSENINAKTALYNACELGLYDALLVRSESTYLEIRKNLNSEAEKNLSIKKLIGDTNRLTNLYWGLGYVQAGCKLYALAALLLESGEVERSKAFKEEAIQKFLCAALLDKNDYSNEIVFNITGKKALGNVLNEFFETNGLDIKFTDWTNAKIFLSEMVGRDRFDTIANQAKVEIEHLQLDRVSVRNAP